MMNNLEYMMIKMENENEGVLKLSSDELGCEFKINRRDAYYIEEIAEWVTDEYPIYKALGTLERYNNKRRELGVELVDEIVFPLIKVGDKYITPNKKDETYYDFISDREVKSYISGLRYEIVGFIGGIHSVLVVNARDVKYDFRKITAEMLKDSSKDIEGDIIDKYLYNLESLGIKYDLITIKHRY